MLIGGNPTTASPAATNYLYTGEQYDNNLQQYYLRARYYDPATGRFNRTDPYAGSPQDPQSLHKYLYCHANPTNHADPSGLIRILPSIRRMLRYFTLPQVLRILIGIKATYVLGLAYISETGANPLSVTINRQIARLRDLRTREDFLWWIADFALRPDIVDHDRHTVYEIKPDAQHKIVEGRLQINRYIAALNIRHPGSMYVPGSWSPRAWSYLITELPGIIGLPTIHITVRNAGWGIIAYEVDYQDLDRATGLLLLGVATGMVIHMAVALSAQAKMYPGLVTARASIGRGLF